ncbi:acyltransferase family protein [Pandoraea fibrosis]|uniref:O-acetyltransferase OatA n=1 Tax=Pandoraea fibrosis TaxID=1891094 RepID=A0A5E4SMC1_9BURK|nr:acyltransferase family protein [Pandoraea fibrosis]VVD75039.1 O-acetyltransferase OatA [Pandoraea fibrosis]
MHATAPRRKDSSHLPHHYRPDIDGLRAIAVLAVLAFHAFPSEVKGGFIGVDIFFVISGFLISGIILKGLEHGTFSFVDFYKKRIRRIFPALILVLGACLAIGWNALLADEFERLGKHIASAAVFVSNITLWSEAGYFDVSAEVKPLLHLWSLGIEEQFYIVWPFLLFVAYRSRSATLFLLIGGFAASFAINISQTTHTPVAAFYLPASRFWELLAGAILAYVVSREGTSISTVFEKIGMIFSSNAQATVGVALIAAAIALLNNSRQFPGFWALLPVLGAVLLISAGPRAWINSKILANPFMVFVGLISYPLYLWHWPLLSFARIVESETPSVNIRIAAIALSFVLATLTYYAIERPIRFQGKRFAIAQFVLATLIVSMTGLGFAGLLTFDEKGYPERKQLAQDHRSFFTMREPCNSITHADYAEDYCSNIATKNPEVAILGDSHATHYAAVLQRIEDMPPFIQFGRGSCLPIIGWGNSVCMDIAEDEARYVERQKSIKTVVLASRWSVHPSSENYAHALEETVKFYLNLGKRIVILLNVPTGQNAAKCVGRPFRLTEKDGCISLETDARVQDGDYRPIIAGIKARHPNVRIFDPWNFFCDDNRCAVRDGIHILYQDESHLSRDGANFLAQSAGRDLLSLLKSDAIIANVKQ